MISTRELLHLLKAANPNQKITENTIRNAIRQGKVKSPDLFAGRFIWNEDDIEDLVIFMRLKPPSICSLKKNGHRMECNGNCSCRLNTDIDYEMGRMK